jgi:hypothetical protein
MGSLVPEIEPGCNHLLLDLTLDFRFREVRIHVGSTSTTAGVTPCSECQSCLNLSTSWRRPDIRLGVSASL